MEDSIVYAALNNPLVTTPLSLMFGATLPCDWIQIESDFAFLKGVPKGIVGGRSKFSA